MILEDAVTLCKIIEAICPQFGCHVALTGGCLYKDGVRKDIDILFYRIRQVDKIEREKLTNALEKQGLVFKDNFGWMQKMVWNGINVDMLFPEYNDGKVGTLLRPQSACSNGNY